MPKIGFLYSMSRKSLRKQLNAFYDGLAAGRFTEGITGTVEYHLAEDRYDARTATDDLRRHADTLVSDGQVRVIVAAGGPISAVRALEARTAAGSNVPIVFTTVAYPVRYNLVSSTDRSIQESMAVTPSGVTSPSDTVCSAARLPECRPSLVCKDP